MTKIEWTEATWNPIVGCSIVSPGCTNCYAMRMAARLEAMAGPGIDDNGYAVRSDPGAPNPLDHYRGTTRRVNSNPVWTGKISMAPDKILLEPLRRKKPTTYFVNSMGDLFHEDVPDAWIDRAFAVMALCPQHTFQVLTKRSRRMRDYMLSEPEDRWNEHAAIAVMYEDMPQRDSGPLSNVWLGVSAERQQEADARIPDLLATQAAVRFVSAEPLLGAVDLTNSIYHDPSGSSHKGFLRDKSEWDDFRFHSPKIDWVIVGGESGPGARPMHPDWARSIRDQCIAAGVPFFFKQWGAWRPSNMTPQPHLINADFAAMRPDGERACAPDAIAMFRMSRRDGKRLLDGREWNETPKPRITP